MPIYNGPISPKPGESFEPLPAGEYMCEIVSITPRKSKDGDEQWEVMLEADDPTTGRRVKIKEWLTFNDKSANISKWGMFLRCFNKMVVCEDGTLDIIHKYIPQEFLKSKAPVKIVIEEHDYLGKHYRKNRVPMDGFHTYPAEPPKGDFPF